MSYHFLSYHILSYHTISYHIMSFPIISYPIISYHVILVYVYIYIYIYLFMNVSTHQTKIPMSLSKENMETLYHNHHVIVFKSLGGSFHHYHHHWYHNHGIIPNFGWVVESSSFCYKSAITQNKAKYVFFVDFPKLTTIFTCSLVCIFFSMCKSYDISKNDHILEHAKRTNLQKSHNFSSFAWWMAPAKLFWANLDSTKVARAKNVPIATHKTSVKNHKTNANSRKRPHIEK